MIQKIKGTMDILPNETPLFRYIEGVMREEAEKYGISKKDIIFDSRTAWHFIPK